MRDTSLPNEANAPSTARINNTDPMSQEEVDTTMRSLPAGRARGPFYALTFRNFRLFFIGQLISVAGTWMQTVAQNWVVWDITHDARWLGIVSGASAIPYVLFSVWGGHLADRYSKRAILVWTQIISMLLAFVLAILAAGWWIKLEAWHVAVLSGLAGLTNAFNMPAQQAFVNEMVDDREALGNAIALSSLRFNIARVVGPVIAGAVLVKFGSFACFGINALSYIAVIISLLMMQVQPVIHAAHEVNVFEGFSYVASTRRVFRIVLLVGLGSLFAWSITTTLFPLLADQYHRYEAGFSQMMTFNGIGAAVGASLLAGYGDRISPRLQVYGGAFTFCLGLILLSFARSFPVVLGLLVMSGFAMIVFAMSAQILIQEQVPDALRGRVMAVYSMVFQGLLPIGGIEVGFVAKRFSANSAILINASLCLAATAIIFAWSMIDRRAAGAEPAPTTLDLPEAE